jgi:hypothetical protein
MSQPGLLEVLGVTLLVPRVQCLCLSLDCFRITLLALGVCLCACLCPRIYDLAIIRLFFLGANTFVSSPIRRCRFCPCVFPQSASFVLFQPTCLALLRKGLAHKPSDGIG